MQKTQVQSLSWEDILEKEMATWEILAWEILWTEKASRLSLWSLKELDMTEQLNNT